jgi:O-glycosyl hydrolase
VSANDFKDGLIYIFNQDQKGEKDANKFDADLFDSKLLWAMGNFSRFIRPNMKRIEVNIDQEKCKISGFQDKNKVVLVLVNQGEEFQVNLPELKKHGKVKSYVTSERLNLAYQPVNSEKIQIPKQSIVTLVYQIK